MAKNDGFGKAMFDMFGVGKEEENGKEIKSVKSDKKSHPDAVVSAMDLIMGTGKSKNKYKK